MKLSFYIAGEKTAVSASCGCRFPLVLLLSTTSERRFMRCVGRAEGHKRWGEPASMGASARGIRFIGVTNGFGKLSSHVRQCSSQSPNMCNSAEGCNNMCG